MWKAHLSARCRRNCRPRPRVIGQYSENIGAIRFCTASNALILGPDMAVTNWLFVIGQRSNLRPVQTSGVNKMRASRMNATSALALSMASALIRSNLASGVIKSDFDRVLMRAW